MNRRNYLISILGKPNQEATSLSEAMMIVERSLAGEYNHELQRIAGNGQIKIYVDERVCIGNIWRCKV